MKLTTFSAAVAMLVLGFLSSTAQTPFAEIESLKCNFPFRAGTESWMLGNDPEILVHEDQTFEFYLDSIDVETNSARLIGNVAATDVTALRTSAGFHFIETSSAGNMHLLTVFAGDSAAPLGWFRAVYSRHLVLLDQVVPSQNYGTCQVWD